MKKKDKIGAIKIGQQLVDKFFGERIITFFTVDSIKEYLHSITCIPKYFLEVKIVDRFMIIGFCISEDQWVELQIG